MTGVTHNVTRHYSRAQGGWVDFECAACGIDIDYEPGELKNFTIHACPSCGVKGWVFLGPILMASKEDEFP